MRYIERESSKILKKLNFTFFLNPVFFVDIVRKYKRSQELTVPLQVPKYGQKFSFAFDPSSG